MFADQVLCLPRPKVTAPKAPRAPGGGVFQTGNKSALTLPMLFYPNCPLSDLRPRSHVLHTLSPGQTPGQGDLKLPPGPSPTHPLGVWRELPQALLTKGWRKDLLLTPHGTFTIKYLTNCNGSPPGGNFGCSSLSSCLKVQVYLPGGTSQCVPAAEVASLCRDDIWRRSTAAAPAAVVMSGSLRDVLHVAEVCQWH